MSTLLCRIELNKTDGITLTVDNQQGGITHTVVLDGKSITTKSKSNSENSVIVQAPDKISLTCKTFVLNAKTIECTSNEDTQFNSGGNFSIKSDANLNAQSTVTANLKSKTVNISGSKEIKAEGGIINLQ